MKENQIIEWKETWRDEYLRWICGFANAEGGKLVIGRNDRGEVIGLPDARKLLEDIPNKVRDILGILVKVNLRTKSGKEYLEIVVDSYPYPVSYNPSVANAFFRAGEIKAWGRGIQQIFDACREAGTPAPHLEYEPRDLWLEFAFSADYLATLTGKARDLSSAGQRAPETTQETTQETTRGRIIALLLGNPRLTRAALARQIGLTSDGVKYHLEKLKAAGRIRHAGPTKAGHWEIIK